MRSFQLNCMSRRSCDLSGQVKVRLYEDKEAHCSNGTHGGKRSVHSFNLIVQIESLELTVKWM